MIIKPTSWVWIDGRLRSWNDAQAHLVNPTVQYGWGALEGIRCYPTDDGPGVFRLRDHMRRLLDTCRVYHLQVDHDLDELVDAVLLTVAANGLDECYVRPFVRLADAEMGLNPLGQRTSVSVAAWHWDPLLGRQAQERGARIALSSWERTGPNVLPGTSKGSGQYVNLMLAKAQATLAGYDEALLCTADGHVSEAPGLNVFVVRDGRLLTPPASDGILPGITRDTIIRLAEQRGVAYAETRLVRTELYLADEAFLTGTAAEVTPVVAVDDRVIGDGRPGPLTTELLRAYGEVVRGRVMRDRGWVSPVRSLPEHLPEPATTTPDVTGAVAAYYSTVDRDPAAVVELFTEDAEYRRPGYPPILGHTGLRDFYTGERIIASGRHELLEVFCDGPRASVRGRFAGTLRDGSRVDLPFADFFEFASDPKAGLLIQTRHTFFADQQV